jgi:hypothetical protein
VKINIDADVNPDCVKEFILFLDSSLKDKIPKVKSAGVTSCKNLKDSLKSEEAVYALCSQVLGAEADLKHFKDVFVEKKKTD